MISLFALHSYKKYKAGQVDSLKKKSKFMDFYLIVF